MWKLGKEKVQCVLQIFTFQIFFFLYKCSLVFPLGFKVSPFYQYSQWKIGSDLSHLRHIPRSISFKGNDLYFFEKANASNAQVQKWQRYPRTNNKKKQIRFCTSLFQCWMKGKLNIQCAAAEDCKAKTDNAGQSHCNT